MFNITLDSKDGIRPDAFDMRELGMFLVEVSSLMAKVDPAGKAKIGLASIESNCIKLNISLLNRRALRALALLSLFLSGQDDILPSACNVPISNINAFVRRNDLSVSIPGRHGEAAIVVTKDNPIRKAQVSKMEYRTSIYGELVEVGGAEKPNAHVITANADKPIICAITKDMAKELGNRLYSVIGLKGMATKEEGRITQFKVDSILPYRQTTADEFLDGFKASGFGAWFKDVDDPVAFVREMRG